MPEVIPQLTMRNGMSSEKQALVKKCETGCIFRLNLLGSKQRVYPVLFSIGGYNQDVIAFLLSTAASARLCWLM